MNPIDPSLLGIGTGLLVVITGGIWIARELKKNVRVGREGAFDSLRLFKRFIGRSAKR